MEATRAVATLDIKSHLTIGLVWVSIKILCDSYILRMPGSMYFVFSIDQATSFLYIFSLMSSLKKKNEMRYPYIILQAKRSNKQLKNI